jgi:hypothetical protein
MNYFTKTRTCCDIFKTNITYCFNPKLKIHSFLFMSSFLSVKLCPLVTLALFTTGAPLRTPAVPLVWRLDPVAATFSAERSPFSFAALPSDVTLLSAGGNSSSHVGSRVAERRTFPANGNILKKRGPS